MVCLPSEGFKRLTGAFLWLLWWFVAVWYSVGRKEGQRDSGKGERMGYTLYIYWDCIIID